MSEGFAEKDFSRIREASQVYDALRFCPPASREDLRNYVKVFLGLDIPDKRFCPQCNSPMDYLWHSWKSDLDKTKANGDCVVWANRSGSKTALAAVATLLDCVFRPGCSVRILGGSLDQSCRMYEYFTNFVRMGYEKLLDGPILGQRCRFGNGSTVEILPQSSTAVRGRHVNKLRCDEVDLFEADILSAAKFITQSETGRVSAMEMISTMHRPYGQMHRLITSSAGLKRPVFRWCVWETIEGCTGRTCSQCPLWGYCAGCAKNAGGYIKIDDVITQMQRSSAAAFEAEMLCKRPSVCNLVFADFDPAVHVRSVDYDPNLPLYRAIDFGFVHPFVCLWIQAGADGVIRVIDEYVRSRASIDAHAEVVRQRTPCPEEAVSATFCDPAGAGRNDITGTSAVRELAALGIRTRYKRSNIIEGVELIRRALRCGDGKSRLIISPRCPRLIEALASYRYPDSTEGQANQILSELPVKDGVHDHPIDAMRYFFAGLTIRYKTTCRAY